MGLIAFCVLVFLMISIAAAIIVTSLILLSIFAFIAAGIVSASVMVGLHKRSVSAGFRTLIYSLGILSGTSIGVVLFVFVGKVQHWWTLENSVLIGGITGLLSGVIMSFIVIRISRKLTAMLNRKSNHDYRDF